MALAPASISPVSQLLSSAVTGCGTISLLTQRTRSPGRTCRLAGVNSDRMMITSWSRRDCPLGCWSGFAAAGPMTADAATSPVKKVRRFIRRALFERADQHLGVALVSSEYFETGFEERLHLGVFDIRDESRLDKIVHRLKIAESVRRIALVECRTP